jgi:hypothetical protein
VFGGPLVAFIPAVGCCLPCCCCEWS